MAIIKRDGRREDFSETKYKSFVNWLCSDLAVNPEMLYSELLIPVKDTPVDELLKDIEDTAEKLGSRITLDWFIVSGRAASLSLIKRHIANGFDLLSPTRSDYVTFLASQIYNLKEEDITHDWDLLIETAMNKITGEYNLTINRVRMTTGRSSHLYNGIPETVSLSYLRQAVDGSQYEKGKYDPDHALELFKGLWLTAYTNATPMANQAGSQYRSTGSCTLLTVDDSTKGIMSANSELALHSKHGSGNEIDVSRVAGAGRYIKTTNGKSSGVKPFLRISEAVLGAFNQGGGKGGKARMGAGVVTFPWWHIDVQELLYLKNSKGAAEERIRGLKYAMTTNEYFYQCCEDDEDIYLFCPSTAREFFGDDRLIDDPLNFAENYINLVAACFNKKIPGTKIKAKTVMKWYLENAMDNGHVYETNITNINIQNMLNRTVTASNLCTEVMIPSRRDSDAGTADTGLCYLNSTNMNWYHNAEPSVRAKMVYNQVKTLDNQIETDFYPVPHTTEAYAKASRFIGVGMSNVAILLASEGLRWDSQESLEFMDKLTEDWSYDVLRASCDLAKERGPAPNWKDSKWAEGFLPHYLANGAAFKLTQHEPDAKRWIELAADIEVHGIRNLLNMAIAPTASSGASAGLSEGINPAERLIINRDVEPVVRGAVSMDKAVLNNMQLAWDIPNEWIIKHAAVRQKWIDQGQSISLYAKGAKFSMKDAYKERLLAHRLGVKSIYYVKFQKVDDDICESCS